MGRVITVVGCLLSCNRQHCSNIYELVNVTIYSYVIYLLVIICNEKKGNDLNTVLGPSNYI